MATHSSILAWRIPWTEKPGRLYSPWGFKESDKTKHALHYTTSVNVYVCADVCICPHLCAHTHMTVICRKEKRKSVYILQKQ